MKLYVNPDLCDLHGQCVFTAPELFHFDDSGDLEYTADVPADLVDEAKAAVRVCPAGAIELK